MDINVERESTQMKIDQEILELSIYLTLKLSLQKTKYDMIYQKEKYA